MAKHCAVEGLADYPDTHTCRSKRRRGVARWPRSLVERREGTHAGARKRSLTSGKIGLSGHVSAVDSILLGTEISETGQAFKKMSNFFEGFSGPLV